MNDYSIDLVGTSLEEREKLREFMEERGEIIWKDTEAFDIEDIYEEDGYCYLIYYPLCEDWMGNDTPKLKTDVITLQDFISKFSKSPLASIYE